ncbi:hypothetical protein M407DRAFT_225080 [Tulasnella calospora MUT 4182]|uniref:Ribosomal RNA methyltransferase FtsJ domain-containing protein n=1 Tax=Tulasnella calospora MUT 4182 TaxID=1051891 RepID=A0A0C3L8S5_9AGAM|nr:hypothetical protein M407DRAFT_225080 [Tulasnella calospora MUT 4182]
MSNTLEPLQPRAVSLDGEDPEESLSGLVGASGCQVLEELRELTRKGWEDRSLDAHFASRIRKSATASTPESEVTWLKTYGKSIREMDNIKNFVPSGFLNFLDLGCAPGGYSKYVMEKNQLAFGTGICLPVYDGGHYFILPRYLRSRYTTHYSDMTKYDLLADGTNESDPPLPFRPASFHLVIADGHPLHTREFSVAVPHVLLLSQLIIALIAVKEGGTIFIKLNKPATFMTASLLYLLDSICDSLETVKPRTVHGNRGGFYAIARGIRRGPTLNQYLDELRSMRQEFIDNPPDWDNFLRIYEQIVSLAQLKEEFIPRLIELGTPVWEVQKECLATFLQRKGVKIADDGAERASDISSEGSSRDGEKERSVERT